MGRGVLYLGRGVLYLGYYSFFVLDWLQDLKISAPCSIRQASLLYRPTPLQLALAGAGGASPPDVTATSPYRQTETCRSRL